jgi:hypothetical protein
MAPDPNPTEPYLVVGGTSTGNALVAEDDLVLSSGLASAIGTAKSSAVSSPNGSRVLYRGFLDTESIYRTSYGPFQNPEHITFETGSANAFFTKVTEEPFCLVPAQMDIQCLVDRFSGDEDATTDRQDYDDFPNDDEFIFYELNISNKKTGIRPSTYNGFRPSEFEPIEDTYVPDLNTYHSYRAENPKFGVSYAGDRCKVSLGSITDILDSNNMTGLQTLIPPLMQETHNGGAGRNESKLNRGQTSYHRLNLAMCALPQDQFKYPAFIPA